MGLGRLCLASRGPGHVQGTTLEAFWNVLVPIWEALGESFGSSFGVMLQLFGDIFGVPNSSLFRRRFGGDFR